MERISISGLTIYYDADEREAVDEIVLACEQSVRKITSAWQLNVPTDCRVFIMTTWPRCVFQGAPLGSQILLGLTLPLWYTEFKKRWHYAGGWSQQYGARRVVGIKAPRLIAQTPDPMGEKIFTTQENLEQKVLSIVCHELTHAFSSHLCLPSWLQEGLAMVTADRCLGKPTVLHNTLLLLGKGDQANGTVEKIDLTKQRYDDILLLYIRGYWLTRYLADTYPELVRKILRNRHNHEELEGLIAAAIDIGPETFWKDIDQFLVARYNLEVT